MELANSKKQRSTSDFLKLVPLEFAKLSASGETMNEVYRVTALRKHQNYQGEAELASST